MLNSIYIIYLIFFTVCIVCLIRSIYKCNSLIKNREKFSLKAVQEFAEETKEFQKQSEDLKEKILALDIAYTIAKENYTEIRKKYEDSLQNYKLSIDTQKEAIKAQFARDIVEQQELFQKEKNVLAEELQEITNTLQARLEARRREQEIQDCKENYCLTLSLNEENDIKMLEEVKKKLHNPRILCMLIWQTFFQKKMTALCNKTVGTTSKTGVYKITNQITGECYIGQAVDISTRFKDHAKCGLGIDTPDGNKLYKNMLQYGLQNFSWEVLEECSKTQLDEKEAYYIDAYQAKDFGLNSLAGRNVKR